MSDIQLKVVAKWRGNLLSLFLVLFRFPVATFFSFQSTLYKDVFSSFVDNAAPPAMVVEALIMERGLGYTKEVSILRPAKSSWLRPEIGQSIRPFLTLFQ